MTDTNHDRDVALDLIAQHGEKQAVALERQANALERIASLIDEQNTILVASAANVNLNDPMLIRDFLQQAVAKHHAKKEAKS